MPTVIQILNQFDWSWMMFREAMKFQFPATRLLEKGTDPLTLQLPTALPKEKSSEDSHCIFIESHIPVRGIAKACQAFRVDLDVSDSGRECGIHLEDGICLSVSRG